MLGRPDIEYAHHTPMLDLRVGAHYHEEPARRLLRVEMAMDELERNVQIEIDVSGDPHRSHPALADDPIEQILLRDEISALIPPTLRGGAGRRRGVMGRAFGAIECGHAGSRSSLDDAGSAASAAMGRTRAERQSTGASARP